jgi:hypothetical protein
MAKWLVVMCLALMATGCGGSSSNPAPVTCGPGNCTGCCFNNACQVGSAAPACGHGGAACSACASHQVCLPTLACGLDPAQQWDVLLVSAVVKPTNNGAAWDPDGSAPDPYGSFLDGAIKTTVRQDTYTPAWNPAEGTFGTSADLLAGFHFQLWDSDVLVDDPITANYNITAVDSNFASGTLILGPVDGAESITFSITKHVP